MSSPDSHGIDPSPDALKAEFPGWDVFRGVNHMWYARRLQSSPPLLVMDENTTELRAKIRIRVSRNDNSAPLLNCRG